jgi:hypothetical protein
MALEVHMNLAPTTPGNLCVMLSALALSALCLSPTALAAPPTNVNPAPQIQNPYQVTSSIPDSSTCAPQCIVKFPVVPAKKRLVVTNVSAQLGLSMDSFVIEGNGGAFFVPKGYPAAGTLAAPVTVYFEAGSTPTARFFVQDATQHTSLIVTFVGYLLPLQ